MDWSKINMDPAQKERLVEFIRLMADGITDELIRKIPGLTNPPPISGHQPQGTPIHPTDPAFQRPARQFTPDGAQVYQVQREDDRGQEEIQATTIPQLLAEMNDNLLAMMEMLEERPKQRKRRRKQ